MIDVVILYSWEDDHEYASNWAAALCTNLASYSDINPSFDLMWEPHSNVKEEIKEKIEKAQKIIVIVSKSYNEKIAGKYGMVSYEAEIYNEIIHKSKDKNKILFVLKEKNITLPKGWEDYRRFDLSEANYSTYDGIYISDFQRIRTIIGKTINSIVLCLKDESEYRIERATKKKNPRSQKPKDLEGLFKKKAKENTLVRYDSFLPQREQENRLINFINRNANEMTFVINYIKSGVSEENDLHERMTPYLFVKHFYVPREDSEEGRLNKIIKDLFNDIQHNMLCFQSDRGSGKSVFLKTLADRYIINDNRNRYTYELLDFSDIHDKNITKEYLLYDRISSILYRKFRKKYRSIIKDTTWGQNFRKKIEKLNEIELPSSGNNLLRNFRKLLNELKNAVETLAPSKLDDWYDDWYEGYSKRVQSFRDSADHDMLFYVLMVFYLFALECKPPQTKNKNERYIVVFDNIETFDNGNLAHEIAEYIQKIHSFISRVYTEMGDRDTFFTKFTFIISMRTSTKILFGNIHTDLWNGGKNVIGLTYHDFTVEALVKKIVFLKKYLKDYLNTRLYQSLYQFMLFILPKSEIERALNGNISKDYKIYDFTKNRFLPLFNNNYRIAMDYLFQISTNYESNLTYSALLENVNTKIDKMYDYSINGLRLMVIREIFDDLQEHGFLSQMGFNKLTGSEDYSMTRMVLEFLYWSEIKHYIDLRFSSYEGEDIIKFINVFQYFMPIDKIASILYDMSLYIKNNAAKAATLYAWGHLICFTNLDVNLSEESFTEFIKSIYSFNEQELKLDNYKITPSKIKVKLSDAGMCFVEYYMRNPEFYMARYMGEAKQNALFSLVNNENIEEYADIVYSIIRNCIDKIIKGGENVCVLYKRDDNTLCFYKMRNKHQSDMLQCALFIRCQECFEMVREAIGYFDRLRITRCYTLNNEHYQLINSELNSCILKKIAAFYQLYEEINKVIFEEQCDSAVYDIMKLWNGRYDTFVNKSIENAKYKRTHRERPIINYYANIAEDIGSAINELEQIKEIDISDGIDLYSSCYRNYIKRIK